MVVQESWLLDPDITQNVFTNIQKNFITTHDFWVPVGPNYDGTFFKIARLVNRNYNKEKFPGELLRISLYLQEEAIFFEREVYNLLDLVGDMGGVIQVITIVFGIILYPIAEESFNLKAASQLFRARTNDNDLFKNSK
jgi:hypothetical protein